MPASRPTSPIRLYPLLVVLCAVAAPSSAFAGDAQRRDTGAFLFQWDNDKVVDTDRHYTNGMRIAYSFDTPTGQWKTTGAKLADWAWFSDASALRAGWSLGQDMYTPEDVDTYTPDPLDRPYAGWTYLGFSVQNETADAQDTLEIDVGAIGPAARAGQLQNAFHRLINVSVSRGWRSQIGNEPGLLATRTYKLRADAKPVFGLNALQADVIGHGAAQLGNVRTAAALGATMRVGGNLKEDFGPVYGTFALPSARPSKLTYSLFAGAEARAVARDIFLDGNTFKNSAHVKKNPYVLEGRIGIAAHTPLPPGWWASGVRLSVDMVHRTREFTTQDKADRYGSFQMTLNF